MALLETRGAHRLLRRLPGAVRHRHSSSTKARPSPSSAPTAPASRPSSRSIAGLLPRDARQRRLRRPADRRRCRAAEIVRLGIALVPEGRRLFPSLSVEENLLIGGYGRRGAGYWSLDAHLRAVSRPARAARTRRRTTLSGGQQQMAAIGRALMSNPRVLLCDEISLGLAPIVIRDIYAALPRIKASGTSVILVEQDIVQALKVADRVYCFQEGRMSLDGPARRARPRADPRRLFRHMTAAGSTP